MSAAQLDNTPEEGTSETTTGGSEEISHERRDPRQRAVLALLLVGFGGLFLLNSWSRDFWAPGEIDFAQACLEMQANGDWLEPTISGQPYHEQPILIYWLGLLCESLTGLDPHVAYRLPGALFGVLGIWVSYYAGRAFFSRHVGILALVIHGTTYLYFRTSSWFLTDVVFSSLVSLSTLAFTVRIVWARYSPQWLVVAYGSLALACLAKSPLLAPYFVGVTVLLFLFLQYGLRRLGSELHKLKIPIGLVAVLLVVLPWYVLLIARHGEGFLAVNFLEHQFGRLHGAESHRQAIWYYVLTLPTDFLPWSFFLPFTLLFGHARFSRPAVKVFVIWALVVFVTLSLVSSKYGKYLLPMWTPLAVLMAAGLLDSELESIWEGFLGAGLLRIFPWILRGLAAVALGAGVCLLGDLIPDRLREAPADALLTRDGFKTRATLIIATAVTGIMLGAWLVSREIRRRETLRALYASAASFAFIFAIGTFLYADLNAVKSGRHFAALVKETTQKQPVAIYARVRPAFQVYMADQPLRVLESLDPTGTNLEPKAGLSAYLEVPEERFLIMYEKDRKKLEGDFPSFARKYRSVASGYVGSRRIYWILSNQIE